MYFRIHCVNITCRHVFLSFYVPFGHCFSHVYDYFLSKLYSACAAVDYNDSNRPRSKNLSFDFFENLFKTKSVQAFSYEYYCDNISRAHISHTYRHIIKWVKFTFNLNNTHSTGKQTNACTNMCNWMIRQMTYISQSIPVNEHLQSICHMGATRSVVQNQIWLSNYNVKAI